MFRSERSSGTEFGSSSVVSSARLRSVGRPGAGVFAVGAADARGAAAKSSALAETAAGLLGPAYRGATAAVGFKSIATASAPSVSPPWRPLARSPQILRSRTLTGQACHLSNATSQPHTPLFHSAVP